MRKSLLIAAGTIVLAAAALFDVAGARSAQPLALSVEADRYAGPRPLRVMFSARASEAEGAVRYRWCFDDGRLSQDQNPPHSFRRAGYYTVVVQAKDESGDEDRKSLLIGAWPRWQWDAAKKKPLTKRAASRAQRKQRQRTRKRRREIERRNGLTLRRCTREPL